MNSTVKKSIETLRHAYISDAEQWSKNIDGCHEKEADEAVAPILNYIAELEQRLAEAEKKISEWEAAPEWVKAGDGTLHGAIDYWQDRAHKAEQRLDKAESKLNSFEYAVEHVTETGKTVRSVSSSDGWAIVHKERLTDLEIAEERLAAAEARIAELEIKEFMYDEHSDAVRKCLTLNKQLAATEKALRWVCDVYIVDDCYSDDLRKERLERAVRKVMVKANVGEEE